jgi:hypothetical protein
MIVVMAAYNLQEPLPGSATAKQSRLFLQRFMPNTSYRLGLSAQAELNSFAIVAQHLGPTANGLNRPKLAPPLYDTLPILAGQLVCELPAPIL